MSDIKRLFRGGWAFIASAFLFAQATVFSRMLGMSPYGIPSLEVVFGRFILGLAVMTVVVLAQKTSLKPHRPGLILARGVFNTVAVVLFFAAASQTTIANANILNLTYPAWIFLAAPLINKERSNLKGLLFFVLTMVGAVLIAGGQGGPWHLFDNGINPGDGLALASGLIASFGICFLREARKEDDTSTILWYMFLVGTVMLAVPLLLVWKTPVQPEAWLMLLAAALCGIAGQALLTYGYRYVTANEGSMLSSSGVVISALLGLVFFGELIHPWMIAGGLMVLFAIVGISSGLHKKSV